MEKQSGETMAEYKEEARQHSCKTKADNSRKDAAAFLKRKCRLLDTAGIIHGRICGAGREKE
jgi:hypothetical protein